MQEMRNVKSFFSYASFGALSSTIGVITVPYFTRVLTTEDFGLIGLFLGVLYFLVPLLSVSSEGLIGIKKVNLSPEKYQDFINQYISLIIILALVTVLGMMFFSFGSDISTLLLYALPMVAFLQALSRLHGIELVQTKQATRFGMYRLAVAIVLFGLSYILISLFEFSWDGRILAIILAELLLLTGQYVFTFRSLKAYKFYLTRGFLIEVLKYGYPLLFLLIAAWILNESDRFIVLNFMSLGDVGLYSAAYGMGMAVNVLNNAMTNTVVPVVYELLKNKKGKKQLRRLNIAYSAFILFVSLALAVFFYNYGAYILGEAYADGVTITCIVLVAFGFNGMYRTVGLPLDYLKKTKLKAVNFYIAAVCNIILSIGLINWLGLLAPAIGTLVSFMVLYFITLFFNLKYTKELMD